MGDFLSTWFEYDECKNIIDDAINKSFNSVGEDFSRPTSLDVRSLRFLEPPEPSNLDLAALVSRP